MRKVTHRKISIALISSIGLIGICSADFSSENLAIANTINPRYQITVNSNQDGDIQADRELTLREAIASANGSLTLERLSDTERSQVQPLLNQKGSQIGFNLPSDRTTIELRKALPDISSQNLIIDGTTQTGYDAQSSFAQELAIPQIVAIASMNGSLGETQRTSQGNQITDYARDRRVEIEFVDVRDIEIRFENQESDLQLEKQLPQSNQQYTPLIISFTQQPPW